ncbi:hypothetical protein HY416_04275 [Candidatus Kaiserbacteria bacterium]|nr:hypothetical protein [Candidatus Kaiserbacteria bacterium]
MLKIGNLNEGMSNPLIIFGAGASFDYSAFGNIAPLTNDLVSERFLHHDLLEKYQGANDLLSDMVHQVHTRNRAFETVLSEMRERAAHSPQLLSQFAALEFYLKALFKRISTPSDLTRRAYQVNNYRIINNRIHAYSGGRANIISFNYDTLFEHTLGAKAPKNMLEYISGDIKIFKLHGSHDWLHIQPRSLMGGDPKTEAEDIDWYLGRPDFIENIRARNDTSPYHELELHERPNRNRYAWFPAIAVPLNSKDRYVCPPRHIQALEQVLPKIDRVLIIGWKAGDQLLLEMLSRHLPNFGYKLLVISGTVDGAQKVAEVVRDKLTAHAGKIEARGGGFSDFVGSDISHSFFAD